MLDPLQLIPVIAPVPPLQLLTVFPVIVLVGPLAALTASDEVIPVIAEAPETVIFEKLLFVIEMEAPLGDTVEPD